MKKIAIYGGTFNPIHLAHVKLADCAVKELGLDELIFVPAFVSPFKQDEKMASPKDRLAMINGILDYNPIFKVSDFELSKESVSYTIDTLNFMTSKLGFKPYFIAGFDSFLTMDKWYKGSEILSNYEIITAKRPGSCGTESDKIINGFIKEYSAKINILSMPELDISSRDIRNRVKSGDNIKDLVLPSTEEYIHEHNLYRD